MGKSLILSIEVVKQSGAPDLIISYESMEVLETYREKFTNAGLDQIGINTTDCIQALTVGPDYKEKVVRDVLVDADWAFMQVYILIGVIRGALNKAPWSLTITPYKEEGSAKD